MSRYLPICLTVFILSNGDILHFKKLVRNRQEQAANDAALFIQQNNEIDEGK